MQMPPRKLCGGIRPYRERAEPPQSFGVEAFELLLGRESQ